MRLDITICDGCHLTDHLEPTVQNRGNGKDYCNDCFAKLPKQEQEELDIIRFEEYSAPCQPIRTQALEQKYDKLRPTWSE